MPKAEITPKVNIFIQHQALTMDVKTELISASATEDVDAPGFFELKFRNWDLKEDTVSLSDRTLLDVGNPVKIQMSYEGVPKTVFYGEITGLSAEFARDEVPLLSVQGYDLRHRLMRGQKTQSFLQMKDSAIAQKVVGTLPCEVTDTKVVFDYVAQQNQTDLAFLQSRAQAIGYEVFVAGEKILFRPINYSVPKSLTLNYPDDLIEFSPRLSSLNQVDQVTVRGWDAKGKKALIESSDANLLRLMGGDRSGAKVASKAFGKAAQIITKDSVSSAAEAKQVAQGQFLTSALAYLSAEGRCRGNPGLRAGNVVEITGTGKRFSGDYYVTAATHIYARNKGYQTQFSLRRTAA